MASHPALLVQFLAIRHLGNKYFPGEIDAVCAHRTRVLKDQNGARLNLAGRSGQFHASEHITGEDRASRRDLIATRTIEGAPVGDTLYVRGFQVVPQDQPFMRIEQLPSLASKSSKSDRYFSRQSGSNSDSSASGST